MDLFEHVQALSSADAGVRKMAAVMLSGLHKVDGAAYADGLLDVVLSTHDTAYRSVAAQLLLRDDVRTRDVYLRALRALAKTEDKPLWWVCKLSCALCPDSELATLARDHRYLVDEPNPAAAVSFLRCVSSTQAQIQTMRERLFVRLVAEAREGTGGVQVRAYKLLRWGANMFANLATGQPFPSILAAAFDLRAQGALIPLTYANALGQHHRDNQALKDLVLSYAGSAETLGSLVDMLEACCKGWRYSPYVLETCIDMLEQHVMFTEHDLRRFMQDPSIYLAPDHPRNRAIEIMGKFDGVYLKRTKKWVKNQEGDVRYLELALAYDQIHSINNCLYDLHPDVVAKFLDDASPEVRELLLYLISNMSSGGASMNVEKWGDILKRCMTSGAHITRIYATVNLVATPDDVRTLVCAIADGDTRHEGHLLSRMFTKTLARIKHLGVGVSDIVVARYGQVSPKECATLGARDAHLAQVDPATKAMLLELGIAGARTRDAMMALACGIHDFCPALVELVRTTGRAIYAAVALFLVPELLPSLLPHMSQMVHASKFFLVCEVVHRVSPDAAAQLAIEARDAMVKNMHFSVRFFPNETVAAAHIRYADFSLAYLFQLNPALASETAAKMIADANCAPTSQVMCFIIASALVCGATPTDVRGHIFDPMHKRTGLRSWLVTQLVPPLPSVEALRETVARMDTSCFTAEDREQHQSILTNFFK